MSIIEPKLRLNLVIDELTIEDRDTLLSKIDLILHHVNPDLMECLDYSMLKRYPNNIRFSVTGLSSDDAFELFRLFKDGFNSFIHKDDDYYKVYTKPVISLELGYTGNIGVD
ncbi:MAG: hypothetical protein IJH63_10510 [Methanobrevibacter sp.]|nr:hypothetical protein [Methanosphaera sp.]MBR0371132.1 hypothetical protein [Methanobrevibacter sp.]